LRSRKRIGSRKLAATTPARSQPHSPQWGRTQGLGQMARRQSPRWLLQWGRDLAVTETSQPRVLGFNGAGPCGGDDVPYWLQWGRDLAVTETYAWGGVGRSFNGACGTDIRRSAVERRWRLQWGRDLAVTETSILVDLAGNVHAGRTEGRSKLQWGRDLAVTETPGASDGIKGEYMGRFNGAVTLRSRKRHRAAVLCGLSNVLQWGRDLAVTETSDAGRDSPNPPNASMGP
jgi:hypothetical protein